MIIFDLEGPLSPQDNAYEVMKLKKGGGKIFEALSEYDDILALKEKEGYEPGDTLKLMVPFLIYYGIGEEDIRRVSERAKLVSGMRETITLLRKRGIPIRVISTSYQQHAHSVGTRLGILDEEIASTRLNLGEISIRNGDLKLLKEAEQIILAEGLSEGTIKVLDELYFQRDLFNRLKVEVVGGQRKVDAMLDFAGKSGKKIREIVAIGDSITDYKMLKKVRDEGGLAVAFNANKYCLPYANIAVASVDVRAILPVVDAFMEGGREKAVEKVEHLEEGKDLPGYLKEFSPRPYFSTMEKNDVEFDEILKVHMEMRMIVRGEAGKLG